MSKQGRISVTGGELQSVEVITLFVTDLESSRRFYDRVFGAEVVMADPVSTVLKFGTLMVNLLADGETAGLVTPTSTVSPANGASFLFTIKVADVDATVDRLAQQGVTFLNGPIDRPWGRRTAAFADPSGFVWEIAQELS